MSTMVCRRLPSAQDRQSTTTKPENSDQQDHTMLWYEMGLHEVKRTTNCHTIYVCDIHDPILSVTRLTEQGFDIRFNDTPTMSHNKGFDVPLVQQHNLYYLPATIMNLEQRQQRQPRQTPEGVIAMIAPTTLTQAGPQQVLVGTTTTETTITKDFVVLVVLVFGGSGGFCGFGGFGGFGFCGF